MVWVPTAPAAIPNEETILALLTRSGTDPVSGYITPDDIAQAWQAFLSRAFWRPNRNALINGGFDIWQRGNTPTLTGWAFFADRWSWLTDGTHGRTATAMNGAAESIDGQTPRTFARLASTTAGAATYNSFVNRTEDVRTLAGQTVTLSFYARSPQSIQLNNIHLVQNFGTGGSPSASVITASAIANLTPAWQRFSFTWTLPSVAGKTFGTANNHHLMVEFLAPNNAIWQFDVWGVQLETGAAPTTFEARPLAEEFERCKRYLRAFGGGVTFETVAAGFYTNSINADVFVPGAMRAIPTLTSAGSWQCSDGVTSLSVTAFAVSAGQSNPNTGVALACTVSTAIQFRPCRLESSSLASRLYLSAEL